MVGSNSSETDRASHTVAGPERRVSTTRLARWKREGTARGAGAGDDEDEGPPSWSLLPPPPYPTRLAGIGSVGTCRGNDTAALMFVIGYSVWRISGGARWAAARRARASTVYSWVSGPDKWHAHLPNGTVACMSVPAAEANKADILWGKGGTSEDPQRRHNSVTRDVAAAQ